MEAITLPSSACTFHSGNSHSPGWRSPTLQLPVPVAQSCTGADMTPAEEGGRESVRGDCAESQRQTACLALHAGGDFKFAAVYHSQQPAAVLSRIHPPAIPSELTMGRP